MPQAAPHIDWEAVLWVGGFIALFALWLIGWMHYRREWKKSRVGRWMGWAEDPGSSNDDDTAR